MVKSASSEILCQYNQQPIHVRSRAEQWELPRYEIQLTTKLGEGDGGVIYNAHWRGLDVRSRPTACLPWRGPGPGRETLGFKTMVFAGAAR